MAPLATHHDSWHVHKALGAVCLAHFMYRIVCVFSRGTCFPVDEPLRQQVACVLLHWALALSSLSFPLPRKRNTTAPMIWPAFRLHSILFATRHVVATIVALLDAWPVATLAHITAKTTLVVGTVLVARAVTTRWGGGATTEAMPYPPGVDAGPVKRNYISAQFNATMQCVVGSPTAAFLPLMAIQLAPLLMTLVRKNRIDARTYHVVYAAALYMPYAALTTHGGESLFNFIWHGYVATKVVLPMRFGGVPAEHCWLVGVPLAIAGALCVAAMGPIPIWVNRSGALAIWTLQIPLLRRYMALIGN